MAYPQPLDYPSFMARKKAPVGSLAKKGLGRTYIREWRKHKGLTQETLAARVAESIGRSFSEAKLSRIENAKSPYNQRDLEAIADALSCAPADLLRRNPLDKSKPYDLLDSLKPATRKQAEHMLRALKLADENEEAA